MGQKNSTPLHDAADKSDIGKLRWAVQQHPQLVNKQEDEVRFKPTTRVQPQLVSGVLQAMAIQFYAQQPGLPSPKQDQNMTLTASRLTHIALHSHVCRWDGALCIFLPSVGLMRACVSCSPEEQMCDSLTK